MEHHHEMQHRQQSAHTPEGTEFLQTSGLARAFLQSPEVCRFIGDAVPELLAAWAGENRLQRTAGRALGKKLRADFYKAARHAPNDGPEGDRYGPPILREAIACLPGLATTLCNAIVSMVTAFETLPEEERRALVTHLTRELDPAAAGHALTALFKLTPEEVDTEVLRPLLDAFISAVDFGELAEATASSAEPLLEIWKLAMDVLWQYPAKVISLLSGLPHLAGVGVRMATETVKPFNNLAPDVLADVLADLMTDLDGAMAGDLVNEACEFLKKIHTGSVLIAPPGRSRVLDELTRLLEEAVHVTHPALLLQAGETLGAISEALARKRQELLEENPDLSGLTFAGQARKIAAPFSSFSRLVYLLDAQPTDEELVASFETLMGRLDTAQLAENIATFTELCRVVHREKPDLFASLLSPLAAELSPLLAEAAPNVLNALADRLDDEPAGGPMRKAFQRLGRHLFASEEVA